MIHLVFILMFSNPSFAKEASNNVEVHIVADHAKEKDVKKIFPDAKMMKKRDLASENSAPSPEFIEGLIHFAQLESETRGWDQLELDLLYLRAKRYSRFEFIYYYDSKKSGLPVDKLNNFWGRVDEMAP